MSIKALVADNTENGHRNHIRILNLIRENKHISRAEVARA
jgi:hypothetical protein